MLEEALQRERCGGGGGGGGAATDATASGQGAPDCSLSGLSSGRAGSGTLLPMNRLWDTSSQGRRHHSQHQTCARHWVVGRDSGCRPPVQQHVSHWALEMPMHALVCCLSAECASIHTVLNLLEGRLEVANCMSFKCPAHMRRRLHGALPMQQQGERGAARRRVLRQRARVAAAGPPPGPFRSHRGTCGVWIS